MKIIIENDDLDRDFDDYGLPIKFEEKFNAFWEGIKTICYILLLLSVVGCGVIMILLGFGVID